MQAGTTGATGDKNSLFTQSAALVAADTAPVDVPAGQASQAAAPADD
jgi:hypothetical protein